MERNETKTLYYEDLSDDEQVLLQWYRGNPHSVYIESALLKLLDCENRTKEECQKFQS